MPQRSRVTGWDNMKSYPAVSARMRRIVAKRCRQTTAGVEVWYLGNQCIHDVKGGFWGSNNPIFVLSAQTESILHQTSLYALLIKIATSKAHTNTE